ncbi:MAG: glycoside hydrolase family 3 protein [Bryobacteraceae bacterium]
MLLSRAALSFAVCGLGLLAATRPAPKANTAAQRWLKGLSLHDEIAQLVIMPCYGEVINTRSRVFRQYAHLVRDVHIGGFIVVGRSLHGNVRNAEPYAMAALLNRMQNLAAVPLLVGADFERGASMRVNSATQWPHNMAFAAARDLDASRYEGAATAREARSLGVNWIFAPDADVNNNPDNPIINIRSYGENANEVATHVQAYIEGAHSNAKQPVLVTAKHFPGHGDTAQDSHLGLARIDASRERMNEVELVPFRAAIRKGVDAIMTAHMAVPALEPQDIPATVSSKVLTGLLRNELQFNGLIVTDAMNMLGLSQMFDTGEASVRALEAGADVLLMPNKAEDAIRGVEEAIRGGRLTKQRLDQSVTKVLAAKARVGLSRKRVVDLHAIGDTIDAPEDNEMAQKVADHAVTLVKDEKDLLPLRNAETAVLVVLSESRGGQQGRRLIDEVHKRSPKMQTILCDSAMSTEDLDQAAKSISGASSVVIAAFVTVAGYRGNVALGGEYPAFVNQLLAGPAPVTLASLGNPYLVRAFPAVKAYLTTYSPAPPSEIALAKALFGEIPITGHLPVTIPGIAKYGDGIQLPASSTQKGL